METQDSTAQAQEPVVAAGGEASYERSLSLFDGVMVVAGGIIGSGIFRGPDVVAERVDTPALILAAWAVGGAIALVGALCFAELGARRPEAGGGYVYLREAFSPLFGFLYGWKMLLISATGAIAALAITFADYTVELAGLPGAWVTPLAVAAIVFLSGVNYFGVRLGSLTQNIFTVLKLLALAGLIGVGLLFGAGEMIAPETAAQSVAATEGTWGLIAALGGALIPVLFAHGGWQHANHIAGEIKNPNRNLPLSLLVGVGIVVGSYLLANLAYLYTLGVEGLAGSDAPAVDAMQAVAGDLGGTLIGIGIVISVFGILNLIIMAAPRVYQTMAGDGLFFDRFAKLHPRYNTPAGAIVLQAAWAILLTLTGTFSQLLSYVVFGDWILFALIVATLFVYRRGEDDAGGNTFRMIGYPMLPVLFILASLFVVVSTIASNPANAAVGGALILVGVGVYFYWRRPPVGT